MGESAIASDSLSLNSSRDAHIGTWWFETVIVGTEWDPALFTKKLNDCREVLPPVHCSCSHAENTPQTTAAAAVAQTGGNTSCCCCRRRRPRRLRLNCSRRRRRYRRCCSGCRCCRRKTQQFVKLLIAMLTTNFWEVDGLECCFNQPPKPKMPCSSAYLRLKSLSLAL